MIYYDLSPNATHPMELIVSPERAGDLKKISRDLQSISLSQTRLSDLELLMNGSYYPLRGFMTETEYESVLKDMRLPGGSLWPLPVCLDVSEKEALHLKVGQLLALRDREGFMVAVMIIEDIFKPDKKREAEQIFGTDDISHPGVEKLMKQTGDVYIGGAIEGIQFPIHFAFRRLRHTPTEMRNLYRKLGWRRIVGYHIQTPPHRVHLETTLRAMSLCKANLLLHAVLGPVKSGNIDAYTRIRCYLKITEKYPPNMMQLSLIPYEMRMAGPKEALLHAIIRKNYGCTHFVIESNHAGDVEKEDGSAFYAPEAAPELVKSFEKELGIGIVPSGDLTFDSEEEAFLPREEIPVDHKKLSLSDEKFMKKLRAGKRIPDWFTFPEVIDELRKAYPPRHEQGITIFCTGLSGAGKSTIARILYSRFLEMGGRPVTLLDGDIVRKNLSNELGFSREHRDINVRRIGFVASEITKNKGIAICAPIAPYSRTRSEVRKLIESYGGFVEVFVSTPIEVCEKRDRKGLYAKARAGMIQGFTGVNDPYEAPERPEVRIDTTDMHPDEAAQEVLLYLERSGYIR